MTREDERMAMLEAENSNLQQKIAVLEAALKEFEANRVVPLATSWVVANPLDTESGE